MLTSFLTSSTFSPCLLKMCFLTNSGPLNFLPDSGHSHLSLASSCVFACMNFSTSLQHLLRKLSLGLLKQVVLTTDEGKVKSSSLAYKRHETRDKRLLGRDPGRNWCHLLLITAHGSMDIGGSIRLYCRSAHGL